MGVLTVAVVMLASFEVGYFMRTLVWGISSRLFRSRIHPLQCSTTYGIVTTRDIDFFLTHLNNSRYLRVMDFGRIEHFVRCHLTAAIRKLHGSAVVASSVIRYRKPVHIFSLYAVDTGIMYWDDRSFYYRQDVRTLHDNFIRATAYIKVTMLGCTPLQTLQSSISGYKGGASLASLDGAALEAFNNMPGWIGSSAAASKVDSSRQSSAVQAAENVVASTSGGTGVKFASGSVEKFAPTRNGQHSASTASNTSNGSEKDISNLLDLVQKHDDQQQQECSTSTREQGTGHRRAHLTFDDLIKSGELFENYFVDRPLPLDLSSFIRYNELSSIRLRAGHLVSSATQEAFKRINSDGQQQQGTESNGKPKAE